MRKVGKLMMVQGAVLELMRLNFLSAKVTPDYNFDGVPALAIQGRLLTSPSQAGSAPRSLAVTGALTQLVRKG